MLAATIAVGLSATVGATASSAAVWEFGGKELKTVETVKDTAETFILTVPGAKITCTHVVPAMTISNSAGSGKAEITAFPMFECTTNTSCTVEEIEAQGLPWPAHLTTVVEDYLVIEKIKIHLLFGGALCALAEVPIEIKGSAGGIINNVNHTITFEKKTFAATKTSLKVGSSAAELTALFHTEALGVHKGEGLEG
ncbi:MAG TPA: hypothetical protein VGL57_06880 [Solirubrobacteraceae bacterium]|jgi:hypothetical protein